MLETHILWKLRHLSDFVKWFEYIKWLDWHERTLGQNTNFDPLVVELHSEWAWALYITELWMQSSNQITSKLPKENIGVHSKCTPSKFEIFKQI